jgi:NAD(P)H dehydrogenase (quinone)
MDQPLIAVTGATGAVGGRVARELARAGARQVLLVRDPSRAPELPGADVHRIAGYAAGDDVRAALEGADTLFLVPGAEVADRVEQHKTAVDAAVAARVRRIVYLSAIGAAPDATWTLVRQHWQTEEHIRASGVAWTFPRMNLYMDYIPSMVGADGVIRGPADDGRIAAVLRDDLAAAIAALLHRDGHDGRTYDLTGPEAFTLAEAAALMSRMSGKRISFHDESDEEAFASRARYGAPDWEVLGWVSSYWAIREGALENVSPHVRELTGRDPVSLAGFLESSPDALAHVTSRERPEPA